MPMGDVLALNAQFKRFPPRHILIPHILAVWASAWFRAHTKKGAECLKYEDLVPFPTKEEIEKPKSLREEQDAVGRALA